MKNIYVATKARGFLLDLFKINNDNITFRYTESKIYETNSKKKQILSKIVKSRLADHLGIIQRVRFKEESCNMAFSYNRFLSSDKDYVIYLENPLALVHYSLNRNKTIISKLKLKKYLNDPYLKGIICLSKACYDTVHRFYDIPDSVRVSQVYPLVRLNPLTSQESIKGKAHEEEIKCLYISSDFSLKGGKEILATFEELKTIGIGNIKLNIITKLDSINSKFSGIIKKNKNIKLFDFNFNRDELNELYNESNIYLNPTRQDSFSLVVLEAIKSGNAILTTDLYAIPEMVKDQYNGYLTNPKYRFFNYDNLPNDLVWNNRRATIYSDYIDDDIVHFLLEKLLFLNENRMELERLELNSFEMANAGEFNEDSIINKWIEIFT